MTIQDQIIRIFDQQITLNKHCLLSTVRNKLNETVEDRELIDGAINMKRSHKQLELLCYVSYLENEIFYTYYDVARNLQMLLIRQHNGAQIKQLFIQFLCVYVKKDYEIDEIIQVVLNNTRELYKKGYENQIQRNLTKIPPNAIMANGKMYCQLHPEEFQGLDMSEDLAIKIKQALKDKGLHVNSTKSNVNQLKTHGTNKETKNKQALKPTKSKQITQPPRINEPKKHSTQQQFKQAFSIDKNPQQKEKAKLSKKKLLIQSQSQQYHHQNQPIQLFDLKRAITSPSMMELENQGNYLENQLTKTHQHQKMEIQQPLLNHLESKKQSNPKQSEHDEEDQDSMDYLMNKMNKTQTLNQHQNNKPSVSVKSMPAAKQTKLTEFCSKFPELIKSQSVRQGKIDDFFGKKKQ